MVHPSFTHIHHHIFNPQRPSTQLLLLVSSTFAIKNTTFSGTAMLDSGGSTCIVPISQLPKEVRKNITHSNIHVKGINGSITILGELNCDITISNHNSPVFKEINVLLTAQAQPILIGQNIRHDTLNSYSIKNYNATIEFRRMLTSGHTVHTASIIPATINSTTGVSPHYTITGHHPNIGLPKLDKKKIANNDPEAYGM